MNVIIADLALDFCESESRKSVFVKQGDSEGSRLVRIRLFNNGVPVALSASDTAELYASINGVATATGEECDIENNKILVFLDSNVTAIAGREHCEVRISTPVTGETRRHIYTARFDLVVGAAAVTDDTPEYIASATIFDRLDALEQAVSPATSSEHEMYPVYTTNALHPEWTKSYITETVGNGTMYGTDGNNGYYRIAANAFDRDKDGLLITRARNGASKFIASPYYTLYSDADYFEDPEDIHGDTIVAFGNVGFEHTDTVRLWIYKKPTSAAASITYGTTVGMSVGMTSAYQGTSEEVNDD